MRHFPRIFKHLAGSRHPELTAAPAAAHGSAMERRTRMAGIARRDLVAGIGALSLASPGILRAQDARQVLRIVVTAPRGDGADWLARLLADRLIAVVGQAVVVENVVGAGGLAGAEAVATAPADGMLIGIIGAETICAAPALRPVAGVDPVRDLRAVTQITDTSVLLAVQAERARARGWTDLPATLAWAKDNPGALRIAHSGAASAGHLALAALAAASGIEFAQLPDRGGVEGAADAVAGEVDGLADLPAALLPHIRAGRLLPLGVSSRQRLSMLSDVAGFAESPALGLGEIDIRSWNMIVVPAATPTAELYRLFGAIRRVAIHPQFPPALRPHGYDVALSMTPDVAARMIADEMPRWRRLAELAGARLN